MPIYELLSSPVIVFLLIMGIGASILFIGSKIAPRGRHSSGKHAHYACGEEMASPKLEFNYHAFYRLALLFGICHIIALVISTIPSGYTGRVLPFIYLLAAGLSLVVLLERQ